MGNDSKLMCLDCNQDVNIGRAYHYNKEAINKKLKKDTLDKLKLIIARFNSSLQQIDMFGEDYDIEIFEDIINFLEQHKGHNIYLIDDYYGESAK